MNDTHANARRIEIGALGALIAVFDAYVALAESYQPCPPDYNLVSCLLLTVFVAGAPILIVGTIGAFAALKLPKRARFVLMFTPLVLLATWPIVAGLPHATPGIGTEPCPIADF